MARYTQEDKFSVAGLNAENEKISVAFQDTLSRKGDSPNTMETDIDMNGYTLNNLADPLLDQQPVTKAYADATYGAGSQFAEAAQQSYTDTLALYNSFFDVYIGPFASNPSGSFDVGDLYYNTTLNLLRAWDGTAWVSVYAVASETFTDVTVDSLQFTGGAGDQGKMSWNAEEETVDLIQNGTVLQLGQESQRKVENNTGATILNGTPVMYAGTVGASGKIRVEPMDGTVEGNFRKYLGLATEDIPNGGSGKVSVFGKVRSIDTSSFSAGDELWVSTSVVGEITNTEPTSGMKVLIGYVINSSATTGTIALNTERGAELVDLHDFNSTGLTSGDVIRYNGSSFVRTPQFRETVYSLVGTDIDPANGTIQTKTLTANTTFTESLSSGDSVTLMIDDGTGFTVTWPTISWVGGSAPTLETTGDNVIVLWKVGSTLYGSFIGAA